MRRFEFVIASCLVAVFGLAACGGSSSSSSSSSSSGAAALPAAEWVARLCTAGLAFDDAVSAAQAAIQNTTPASLAEAKQQFVSFFDTSITALNQLESKMAGLGTPAVSDGSAAVAKAKVQFDQLKTALTKARTEAEALPTDDQNAFSTGADAIGNELSNLKIGDNGTLTFGQADLDNAYKANADCQKLENGPSASP